MVEVACEWIGGGGGLDYQVACSDFLRRNTTVPQRRKGKQNRDERGGWDVAGVENEDMRKRGRRFRGYWRWIHRKSTLN